MECTPEAHSDPMLVIDTRFLRLSCRHTDAKLLRESRNRVRDDAPTFDFSE
jgi:hypothetical protein